MPQVLRRVPFRASTLRLSHSLWVGFKNHPGWDSTRSTTSWPTCCCSRLLPLCYKRSSNRPWNIYWWSNVMSGRLSQKVWVRVRVRVLLRVLRWTALRVLSLVFVESVWSDWFDFLVDMEVILKLNLNRIQCFGDVSQYFWTYSVFSAGLDSESFLDLMVARISPLKRLSVFPEVNQCFRGLTVSSVRLHKHSDHLHLFCFLQYLLSPLEAGKY